MHRGQDHRSLRRRTLLFLKLYELFYPGEHLAQQKSTASMRLPAETDHQYFRRQRTTKYEERSAYLQFYQFMVNVEKTLFFYQQ